MHISSPCRLLAQPGHIGTHRPIRSISLLQHPRDHHTDDHCTSLRLGCVSKCLKDGDDLGRSILNYLLPSMYTFDHCGIFLKHLVAISSPLPQKSIDFFHLRTRPFPPAMANPTSARDDESALKGTSFHMVHPCPYMPPEMNGDSGEPQNQGFHMV